MDKYAMYFNVRIIYVQVHDVFKCTYHLCTSTRCIMYVSSMDKYTMYLNIRIIYVQVHDV